MDNKLIIYGSGDMAKMLYYFIKDKYEVVGFCVDSKFVEDGVCEKLPLISFDNIEKIYSPLYHYMIIAVGFVQMNGIREIKYKEAKLKGYKFINYIHPSVVLHENLEFGENNIILDYVSIHPYTTIGNSNFISSNTNIGHNCSIKDNCWINAGVSIAGNVTIDNNCFFGINSSASHGIYIAYKTFIDANTYINHTTMHGDVYLSHSAEKFRLKSDLFLKFANIV